MRKASVVLLTLSYFVLVNGQPYRRRPLDAAWVLER